MPGAPESKKEGKGNCEALEVEVSYPVPAADLDSIPTKRIRHPDRVPEMLGAGGASSVEAIRTAEQLPEMASRGLGLVPETTHS